MTDWTTIPEGPERELRKQEAELEELVKEEASKTKAADVSSAGEAATSTDEAAMAAALADAEMAKRITEAATSIVNGGLDQDAPTGPLASVKQKEPSDEKKQDEQVLEDLLWEKILKTKARKGDLAVEGLPKRPENWSTLSEQPPQEAERALKIYLAAMTGAVFEQKLKLYNANKHVCEKRQCVFPGKNLQTGQWDITKCERYLAKLEDIRNTRTYETGGMWLENALAGSDEHITFHLGPDHPVLKIMQEPKTFSLFFDQHFDPIRIKDAKTKSTEHFIDNDKIDMSFVDGDLEDTFKRIDSWAKCSELKCMSLKCDETCEGTHGHPKDKRMERMHPYLFLPTCIEITKHRNNTPFDISVDLSTLAVDHKTANEKNPKTMRVHWTSASHSNAFTNIPNISDNEANSDVVSYAHILSGNIPSLTEHKQLPVIFEQDLCNCILQRQKKWGGIWNPIDTLNSFWSRVDGSPNVRAIAYQTIGERFMVSPNPVQLYLAEQLKRLADYEGADSVFATSPNAPKVLWRADLTGIDEPEWARRVRAAIWIKNEDAINNVILVNAAAFQRHFLAFIESEVARARRIAEFPKNSHAVRLNCSVIKSRASADSGFLKALEVEHLARKRGIADPKFDDYFKIGHVSVEVRFSGHVARIAL